MGFGGALFALMLGIVWRERMGKPIVFGIAALVGAFGLGWAFAVRGVSVWVFLTSAILLALGIIGLGNWVETEIRFLERLRATHTQDRKRKPKDNAAD